MQAIANIFWTEAAAAYWKIKSISISFKKSENSQFHLANTA